MGRRRRIKDEQILLAARQVFVEHGPSVSTTVVAKRAGVSQALLFQRFGTKEKLLIAALGPPAEVPWLERLAQGPDERDLSVQLHEIISAVDAHMRAVATNVTVLCFSGLDIDTICRESNVSSPMRVHRGIAQWFCRAERQGLIRSVDADAVVFALLGALHARHSLAQLADRPLPRRHDAEPYLDDLIHLLLRGIAPGGPLTDPED